LVIPKAIASPKLAAWQKKSLERRFTPMRSLLKFLSLVAVVASVASAHADPIVYTLNQSLSGSSSSGSITLTGTLTTDGTLGALDENNFTNVDVNITQITNSGTSSVQSTRMGIIGSDLTATSTGLFFDFSENGEGIVNLDTPTLTVFILQQTVEFSIIDGVHPTEITRSGNIEIASAATVTPEPSSFVLLGTGVFGIAGVLRKRFA
jgi:hypothetical protein